MDERRLRYFVAVAQAGSFSAAARNLHIAQPALSRHVRLLEMSLNRTLLVRGSDGISLTNDGRKLLDHGRQVLEQFDSLAASFGMSSDEVAGRVTFGVPPTISPVFAKAFLHAAAKKHPSLKIHLVETLSKFLCASLENGEMDFAILFDDNQEVNCSRVELLKEPLCLIGKPSAKMPDANTISFRELSAFPLVVKGAAHAVRKLLDKTAAECSISLNIAWEADSLPVVRSIIGDGKTYVISTRSAYIDDLSAGRMRAIEIVDPLLLRSILLATAGTMVGLGRAHAMRHLVREVVGSLMKQGRWTGSMAPTSA
jgi:LysR family nitrogen assimilation transcriptional regulator